MQLVFGAVVPPVDPPDPPDPYPYPWPPVIVLNCASHKMFMRPLTSPRVPVTRAIDRSPSVRAQSVCTLRAAAFTRQGRLALPADAAASR
jgi:hypothetical protein